MFKCQRLVGDAASAIGRCGCFLAQERNSLTPGEVSAANSERNYVNDRPVTQTQTGLRSVFYSTTRPFCPTLSDFRFLISAIAHLARIFHCLASSLLLYLTADHFVNAIL